MHARLNAPLRLLAAALTTSVLLGAGANALAQSANYKNSREYQDAYACGKESLESDPSGNSAVSFCVGNSRDPSKIEMQAYKDAATAAKRGPAAAQSPACTFGYGVYQANGSRADNFEEGPQKVTTMKQVALLASGREIQVFDAQGKSIPLNILQQWFKSTAKGISLTPLALKTCSKKQIG
ncbi:hypothetical protein [Achromobacter denitrificans]|uniref:hypothetical protein n=1 Tax=Achromobacter denitrificans TaxID=32002 RepID=UPI000F672B11|nr:hypothetical protein [Achromobacter denitrificans]RSE74712.1 hypothetical protein EGU64_32445 [Achromobacter denitrificans]